MVDSSKDAEDPAPVYTTFTLSCDRTGAPLTVVPILNNMAVCMEIDTRALVSSMSDKTYLSSCSAELRSQMEQTTAVLRTYSGRAIPHLASNRIQRWALILSGYDYTIQHKSGRDNLDADALSRLPLPDVHSDVPLPDDCVLLLQTLKQSATVTAKQIQTLTNTDPVLSKVCQFVLHGWPARVEEEELKPFFRHRLELMIVSYV